jgi:dCTP deaminase
MFLTDKEIKKYAEEHNMLEPFLPESLRYIENVKIFSKGLGSYGYDISLSAKEFFLVRPRKISINPKTHQEDVKLEQLDLHTDEYGSYFFMPGLSTCLGVSVEKFTMPNDITGVAWGKSSYARAGILANLCPIEAGWSGHLTLSLFNSNSVPCRIYANEGVAQVLFAQGGDICDTPYHERESGGKYTDEGEKVLIAKV